MQLRREVAVLSRMITVPAILPALSLLKWPATITGAVLVFGLSTDGTLSLVASNAHRMTSPVQAAPSFNLPPIKQIGEINPRKVEPKSPVTDSPAASIGITPSATTEVALRQPAEITSGMAAAMDAQLRPGHIGASAVNVRAMPSKDSAKLGALAAGAPIQIGETERGWVHVQYEGGQGWVYSTYIAGPGQTSITVRGGAETTEPLEPSRSARIEASARIVAREDPRSSAPSVFRIEPGERVKVLDREGRWVKVATADGLTGWIKTK